MKFHGSCDEAETVTQDKPRMKHQGEEELEGGATYLSPVGRCRFAYTQKMATKFYKEMFTRDSHKTPQLASLYGLNDIRVLRKATALL